MRYLLLSVMLYLVLPAHTQQITANGALPDTTKFNSVCRVDSVITWAVGDSGKIYRRAALGWAQIRVEGTEEYKLNSVFVLKERPEYVWIVGINEQTGRNVLLKTNSGKAENPCWLYFVSWPFMGKAVFTAIKFNDRFMGYIYGPNGVLMQSHDGGETWKRVPGGRKP